MKMKLRDRIWLWGQDPGGHHASGVYKLPGVNKMDSKEGCEFFGINRCCRVAMGIGPQPPFDAESEKIAGLREVVWSVIGAGGVKRHSSGDQSDLGEVLRQAEMYPNITGGVLDDFFTSVEGFDISGAVARHSLQSLRNIRRKLHEFPQRKLDLWLVLYTYQLGMPIREYLDECDIISLWTWQGEDLKNWEENYARTRAMTGEKPIFAGCYMWNYGKSKPLTMDEMKFQLDVYYKYLMDGRLKGMVLCSNCIADIGLETVEYTKKWIAEHGDEYC